MKSLTWDTVRRRRLARNCLIIPAARTQLDRVVRAVCGLQAQILTAAELALGTRVAGLTRQDVQAELWERRRLVKTYGPRGTLHLLPADELPLWMSAMRARATMQDKPWHTAAGLSQAQAEALVAAIGRALDGRCLTREELAREVSGQSGSWAKDKLASTWGELLPPAAYAGWLCFGPSQGSQVTFVRADQWIGHWRDHEPEKALLEVLRRYLAAYGPATAQAFARWFWLKPAQAQGLLDALADELTPVDVEGQRAWALRASRWPSSGAGPGGLRLVPQYDCYVLGSYPREQILPETARARIFAYGRGRLEGAVGLPILLSDGVVAGMWQRRTRGGRAELRVEAFIKLTRAQRAELDAETARLGAFLNTSIALSLGRLE